MIRAIFIILCLTIMGASAGAEATEKISVAVPQLLGRVDLLGPANGVNGILAAQLGRRLVRVGKDGFELEEAAQIFTSADSLSWGISLYSNRGAGDAAAIVSTFKLYKSLAAWLKEGESRDGLRCRPVWGGRETCGAPLKLEKMLNLQNIHVKAPKGGKGQFRIEFDLMAPDGEFPEEILSLPLLSSADAAVVGRSFGTGNLIPVSGAYFVGENRPEKKLLLLPRGNAAATLEFRRFADTRRGLSTLRSGGVDILLFPTRATLDAVKGDPTIEVRKFPEFLRPPHGAKLYWQEEPGDEVVTDLYIARRSFELGPLGERFFMLADSRHASGAELWD